LAKSSTSVEIHITIAVSKDVSANGSTAASATLSDPSYLSSSQPPQVDPSLPSSLL